MVSVKSRGDFRNLERYLKKSLGRNYRSILKKYGEQGVAALSAATPVDTGLTASSWWYEIVESKDDGYISINQHNDNVVDGINIALILQLGHATKKGPWVEGKDYIGPALEPIFEDMAQAAWKEVTNS